MKLVPSLEFFTYSIRKGGLRPIWLTEVSELNGGEKLDLPGSPEVIDVPGHSPGSIAVYSAEVDALFVGDALTTRHVLTGREGSQAAPFTDDPSQAAASLEKLVSTEARWVLPGHGAPWNEGVKSCVAAASARASASPGHTT